MAIPNLFKEFYRFVFQNISEFQKKNILLTIYGQKINKQIGNKVQNDKE
jgi:hypothetical protein